VVATPTTVGKPRCRLWGTQSDSPPSALADTSVTFETAKGLLRRHDPDGITLIVTALGSASDSHVFWIGDAINEVLSIYAEERDAALGACRALADSQDALVRAGAIEMISTLVELKPLLKPRAAKDARKA
jgi:hypothetical protein